jgi:hypothetical protein
MTLSLAPPPQSLDSEGLNPDEPNVLIRGSQPLNRRGRSACARKLSATTLIITPVMLVPATNAVADSDHHMGEIQGFPAAAREVRGKAEGTVMALVPATVDPAWGRDRGLRSTFPFRATSVERRRTGVVADQCPTTTPTVTRQT